MEAEISDVKGRAVRGLHGCWVDSWERWMSVFVVMTPRLISSAQCGRALRNSLGTLCGGKVSFTEGAAASTETNQF